jgi:hypothetical protein
MNKSVKQSFDLKLSGESPGEDDDPDGAPPDESIVYIDLKNEFKLEKILKQQGLDASTVDKIVYEGNEK